MARSSSRRDRRSAKFRGTRRSVGLAARRMAEEQGDLAVREGCLGQVVAEDEGMLAVVADILGHVHGAWGGSARVLTFSRLRATSAMRGGRLVRSAGIPPGQCRRQDPRENVARQGTVKLWSASSTGTTLPLVAEPVAHRSEAQTTPRRSLHKRPKDPGSCSLQRTAERRWSAARCRLHRQPLAGIPKNARERIRCA